MKLIKSIAPVAIMTMMLGLSLAQPVAPMVAATGATKATAALAAAKATTTAVTKPEPPRHIQLNLEFSPKLKAPELPATLNPRRIKLKINYEIPRSPALANSSNEILHPLALTSGGNATLTVEFANQSSAVLAGSFELGHQPMSLTTPALSLRADALAPFLPQPLIWQGRADYEDQILQLAGVLTLPPEVKIEHRAKVPSGLQGAEAEFKLREIRLPQPKLPFMKQLEQLALPFALPEFEDGRLDGQISLEYPETGLRLRGQLNLLNARGIHQTSFFHDLNLALTLALEQKIISLPLIEINIREFNPGMAFGPIRAKGSYQAPVDDFGRGRLELLTLEAGFLGGRLLIKPFVLDMGRGKNITEQVNNVVAKIAAGAAGGGVAGKEVGDFYFEVLLDGLDLAKLLAVYPVQGLSGSGLIDGRLPLRWADGKISLANGQLAARPTGGLIKVESATATAMTRRNPALKLILDALSNFHYHTLSANVTYHDDGTMILNLRIAGSNPALEQGRPILLEISIEENIPALLAALQLDNQISDTIRRRIEERFK